MLMKDEKMSNEQLAQAEAAALSIHATEEEKGRLDLETLDPGHYELCVYGQMTGDCYSERALELLRLCGVPDHEGGGFTTKLGRSNSHLEIYIGQPGADIAGIVRVIKGE
jgi:hypothetical protein